MVSTTVDEETGEEKKRLINKMRWKGYGPASIAFTDPTVYSGLHYQVHNSNNDTLQVPDKPPVHVEEVRDTVDQKLLKILQDVIPFSYLYFQI
jgi:general transcription factor 3C polypeptide 5 (transcription factor C subunit 1)